MPGLSLVIPSWNGRELLARFLPSVVAAAPGCEIIVCDDGSTDGTAAWLAAEYPQIRCLTSAVNRGFGPTANAGVAAAQAPIVVLLNNDLELTPASLRPVALWFANPGLFGVTFRALDFPDQRFATGGKLGRFRRGFWETWKNFEHGVAPAPTFMLVGGFCAFRRQEFLELGGFDPVFAPYYSEDLDLSYRARKRGWNLGYEPAAIVHHCGSVTVGRHRGRFRRAAVTERNRLLFHWRNLDAPRLRAHLIWAHLLLLQLALKGNLAYHAGYLQALMRTAAVRRFRRAERPHWRRADLELEIKDPATSLALRASP